MPLNCQQTIDLLVLIIWLWENEGGGQQPTPSPPLDDDPAFSFDQLDGNISISSEITLTEENLDDSPHLPIQIGFRPNKVIYEWPPHSKKTIRRDNKLIQALVLPRVTNYNMRALFSKVENLALDINERESDLIFLTEVWGKKENKRHQFRLI